MSLWETSAPYRRRTFIRLSSPPEAAVISGVLKDPRNMIWNRLFYTVTAIIFVSVCPQKSTLPITLKWIKAFFIMRNNKMGQGLKTIKCLILKQSFHTDNTYKLCYYAGDGFSIWGNAAELVAGFLPERPSQTVTFYNPKCGKHWKDMTASHWGMTIFHKSHRSNCFCVAPCFVSFQTSLPCLSPANLKNIKETHVKFWQPLTFHIDLEHARQLLF